LQFVLFFDIFDARFARIVERVIAERAIDQVDDAVRFDRRTSTEGARYDGDEHEHRNQCEIFLPFMGTPLYCRNKIIR